MNVMKMSLIAVFVLFLMTPLVVFAQAPGEFSDCPPGTVCLPNPLGTDTTFTALLDRVLTFLLEAGGIIATIMIVIGAFQMLFAGGDPEKFITGRRTIIYTAVAYGILVVAKGISLVIKDILT